MGGGGGGAGGGGVGVGGRRRRGRGGGEEGQRLNDADEGVRGGKRGETRVGKREREREHN